MVPTTWAPKTVLCPMSPSLSHGARAAALPPRSSQVTLVITRVSPENSFGASYSSHGGWHGQGDTGCPPSMRPPFPSTPVPVVTLPKAPAPAQEHPTHPPCARRHLNWQMPALGTPPSFSAPALLLISCWSFLGWDLPGGFFIVQMRWENLECPWVGCSQSQGSFKVTTKHKGLE